MVVKFSEKFKNLINYSVPRQVQYQFEDRDLPKGFPEENFNSNNSLERTKEC